MEPVRIALVHDWLVGMRGGEKCLQSFCELYPDADLYTLIYVPDCVSPTIRAMNARRSWIDRLPAAERYYRYMLPLFPRAMESFDLSHYDLILSSSHCVAKGIFPHRAVHVSYVHSPMRYVWDQHDAYFGADAPWIARTGMALWRRYLQQWDLRSSQRVDYFIANSHNVAAKIRNLYGREAAVIHPPVEVGRFFIQEKQEPYYLIVSALVPYKKIDIAIQAFNELELPLKIVGEGPLRKRLQRMAKPNIEFLSRVSDEALPRFYAGCQALIFPGEDDFGIVPLEAQASGRPVIAYGQGGALETMVPIQASQRQFSSGEDPTGVFFHEPSAESLIAAVHLFRDRKQSFNPIAIRKHACGFAVDRFKTQIRGFVQSCLERRTAEK
jgi:glycosyltransferase involved in cell wall biosynthesis